MAPGSRMGQGFWCFAGAIGGPSCHQAELTFSFAGEVWLFSVVVDVAERTTVWATFP